jgi:uncharacterized protein
MRRLILIILLCPIAIGVKAQPKITALANVYQKASSVGTVNRSPKLGKKKVSTAKQFVRKKPSIARPKPSNNKSDYALNSADIKTADSIMRKIKPTQEVESQRWYVNALRIKADSNFYTGNYERAIQHYMRLKATIDEVSLFRVGESHLALGNNEEAKLYYHMASSKGNGEASHALGYMHQMGIGTTKDYDSAVIYFLTAAENGYDAALGNIAYCYNFGGYGVEQDYAEAIEWYKKAAESGDEYAMNALGDFYFQGTEIDKDFTTAFNYYKVAADKNLPLARVNLGYMYENGYGTVADTKAAYELYEKAAKENCADALSAIGNMYENGLYVPMDMQRAFELYMRAAKQGVPEAMYRVGKFYYNGTAISQDEAQADFWFRQAANVDHRNGIIAAIEMNSQPGSPKEFYKQAEKYCIRAIELGIDYGAFKLGEMNDKGQLSDATAAGAYMAYKQSNTAEAQYKTAEYLMNGKAGTTDSAEALVYLKRAAAQAHPRASYFLGYFKRYAIAGCEENITESLELLYKAAKADITEAQFLVGQAYDLGLGIDADSVKAYEQYALAAKKDYAPALYAAGTMLLEGRGTEKNIDASIRMLARAKTKGIVEAGIKLEEARLQSQNK